ENECSQAESKAQARQNFIRELKEEDEKSPAPAFSRSCGVCMTPSPNRRAVFTACGHVICRACAETLAGQAEEEEKAISCPFCRTETGFVPLFENQI
ncbi:hypothetical protein PENTCL1PPCAC_24241, partial [Pristionchus entomophagus]